MPETGPRPFTLLDAAVLIGATAIGLSLVGYNGDPWWLSLNALLMISRIGEFRALDAHLVASVLLGLTPVLAAWTVAFLGLRLFPPRPPQDELFQQPGMVACYAATATLVAGVLYVDLATRRNGGSLFDDVIRTVPACVGLAVASSWLLLALSRRWRSAPGWLESAGFLAGMVWVELLLLLVWVWVT